MSIFSIIKKEKIFEFITKLVGLILQTNDLKSQFEDIKKTTNENLKTLSLLSEEIESIKNNIENIKKILYSLFAISLITLIFLILILIKLYANNQTYN